MATVLKKKRKRKALDYFASISAFNKDLKGNYRGNLMLDKRQNVFYPQYTKTFDECLWPQMDWVRMGCNLKKS